MGGRRLGGGGLGLQVGVIGSSCAHCTLFAFLGQIYWHGTNLTYTSCLPHTSLHRSVLAAGTFHRAVGQTSPAFQLSVSRCISAGWVGRTGLPILTFCYTTAQGVGQSQAPTPSPMFATMEGVVISPTTALGFEGLRGSWKLFGHGTNEAHQIPTLSSMSIFSLDPE